MMAVRLLLLALLAAASKMTLVETIPLLDLDEIQLAPGAVNTWEAQVALANGAKKTLDVTFMYENLLAESDAPHASSFSRDLTALGVDRGRLVFEAVVAAQRRGVAVRVLASPMGGTANCSLVRALRATPAKFAYAEWDPDAWYGGGIMHMKLWVADGASAYVGSANLDWASLAQVKEFGVLVEDGAVGADLGALFEGFWAMAALKNDTRLARDPRVAHDRRVPAWSALVAEGDRAADPLARFGTPWNLTRPIEKSGFPDVFVAAAPPEVVGDAGRMTDEAAIVATIDDAATSASLAVMDFSPASAYAQRGEAKGVVFSWPAISDALTRAVFARGVDAKLLVSWWPNTDAASLSYLAGLRRTARSCAFQYSACNGTLDVKLFALPGWDALASYPSKYGPGLNGTYPAYTRVAHGKVVVTDRRANVGTSNWQWGYMYETAGASFNTGDAAFTASLQSAFDRDWASSYAVPLDDFLRDERDAACRGRDADGRAKCEAVIASLLPSSEL